MKKRVLLTGASGSMGSAVLEAILSDKGFEVVVLLRRKRVNERLARILTRKYHSSIEIVFGDLSNYDDCMAVVDGVDYVVHCAAIIPPVSDHNPDLALSSNLGGTRNLVNAAKASKNSENIKFINIGSVAEYGHRSYPAHWGRVGDPLLVSAYDFYATTKVKAERHVVESGLEYWVSLRQSGILYDDILFHNMNDGLMFHTPWNCFIEWATARDSGRLIRNLLVLDSTEMLAPDFWRKCYNIGNGEEARVTGFETLDRGMNMMGRSAKDIFKPQWNATRNFHCFWYLDSDKLNDYLGFRSESFEALFDHLTKKFWYFKLGKPFPKTISRLAIQRLFHDSNAPMYWVSKNIDGRINAFYKSWEDYQNIPRCWKDYKLIESASLRDISSAQLLDLRGKTEISASDIAFIRNNEFDGQNRAVIFSHGYDESKADSQLGLEDMQSAAAFRGGRLTSSTMVAGDLYTKLEWECHDGHKFMASPYAVLKAGFWCPECCQPSPWDFDRLAKKIPFYAQIWYNSHSEDEDNVFAEDCYKDIL
ncbi:MAG: NAD(P)-dependent oxidoreductase [Spirochaetales bacterium]|nr:NAD(P)-dependent oxidoreductase [Spirochaetales bacterium]